MNDEIELSGEGRTRTAIWAIKGLDGGPTIHRPPLLPVRPSFHRHSTAGTEEEILLYNKRKERGDINSILESINNVPGENGKWMETTTRGAGKERKEKRQIEDGWEGEEAQMPPSPLLPSFVSLQTSSK